MYEIMILYMSIYFAYKDEVENETTFRPQTTIEVSTYNGIWSKTRYIFNIKPFWHVQEHYFKSNIRISISHLRPPVTTQAVRDCSSEKLRVRASRPAGVGRLRRVATPHVGAQVVFWWTARRRRRGRWSRRGATTGARCAGTGSAGLGRSPALGRACRDLADSAASAADTVGIYR